MWSTVLRPPHLPPLHPWYGNHGQLNAGWHSPWPDTLWGEANLRISVCSRDLLVTLIIVSDSVSGRISVFTTALWPSPISCLTTRPDVRLTGELGWSGVTTLVSVSPSTVRLGCLVLFRLVVRFLVVSVTILFLSLSALESAIWVTEAPSSLNLLLSVEAVFSSFVWPVLTSSASLLNRQTLFGRWLAVSTTNCSVSSISLIWFLSCVPWLSGYAPSGSSAAMTAESREISPSMVSGGFGWGFVLPMPQVKLSRWRSSLLRFTSPGDFCLVAFGSEIQKNLQRARQLRGWS